MKEADCPPRHSPPIFHKRPSPLSSTTTHLVATPSSYPEHAGIKTTIVRNRGLPSYKTVYLVCSFVESLIARKRGFAKRRYKKLKNVFSNTIAVYRVIYVFKK